MSPFNSMENEKKRLRNQFTKDERLRLLNIMTEYGPLLDDKNISILSRKEIWEIIEQKFNDGGHSGRSSAQLKKYWQNYKYHSKRAKIAHQEEPERGELNEVRKNMVRMLADVHAKKWSEYRNLADESRPRNSPEPSNTSPEQLKRESFVNLNSNKNVKKCDGSAMESMLTVLATPSPKTSVETAESNIIVSRTNGPGNSVTVSVICPEIASKARSFFWKKGSPLKSKADSGETNKENQSKEPCGFSQQENLQRVNIVGMFALNNTDRGNSNATNSSKFLKLTDQKLNISRPCRKSSFHGPFAIQSTVRPDLLGGVLDSVGKTQLVAAHSERSTTTTTTKRKETDNLDAQRMRPKLLAVDVANMRQAAISVDNVATKVDDVDMKRILVEFANLDARSLGYVLREAKQVQKTLGTDTDKENGDWLQHFAAPMSNEQRITLIRYLDSKDRILTTDASRRDLVTLKDLLRPLASADDSERRKFVEMLRKLVPKDATADDEQRNVGDECLEGGHGRSVGDEDKEKKRDTAWFDGSKGNGRILVKDLTSLTSLNRGIREIKAEPEESETESAENPSNNSEDRTPATMMDQLVQAKFRCVKSGLDHQIELQKLEMEEKRLRIKIAEMTFQETKLRIQALNEERFRAKELHELRLAQMTVEKVRADAEYVIRMNSTQIDDRGRIASIEGDRKQREDFHPLQLKSLENCERSNGVSDNQTATNGIAKHR